MQLKGIPYIEILKSKLFIAVAIIPLLFGILEFIYFLSIGSLTVFPNNDYLLDYFTDSSIGGNSQIIKNEVTDSGLMLDFVLDKTTSSPYVGIKISRKDNKTFDISKYDQLKINTNGNHVDKIGVAIFTSILNLQKINNLTEILLYSIFTINEENKSYYLKLNQFKAPDWWEEKYNINSEFKPDFKNVRNINISNGLMQQLENIRTLEIHSISFSRSYRHLILRILFFEFIVVFSVLMILILGESFKLNKKTVTINYKPVEGDLKKMPKADFMDYINNHFHNSQLTLDIVASETGISHRKIANNIQDQYNCNFKTYINRLRINESKRLLVDANLNIGEIAYKVGFNNQSHFNRVFKSELNISPSEFRDKNSK